VVHLRSVRSGNEPKLGDSRVGENVKDFRLGIDGAALPVRTAGRSRHHQRGQRALPLAHDGWREDGTDLVFRHEPQGFRPELGREVDEVVNRHPLPVERRRFGHKRLRGAGFLARHVGLRHRPLVDRPDRLPGHPIEHVHPGLFGGLCDRFDRPSVDRNVNKDWRARDVHVPDAVVNELEMPQSFARLQIERDQTLAEQTVAGAMATVVIAGRQLDWQINDAELFVNRNLSPDARVTGVRPRVALPCFVSDLAGPRDGVENPEALARADVIAPDETFLVFWALGCPARQVCGADDHRVPDHYGRGVEAYLARDEIHLLIVFQLQIDNAVVPEPGYRRAGLGVHSDHLIARCDINDPLLPAVGPVRETAARELPWRRFAAFAFVDAVHPLQLP